jgi:hypothetical protein
VVARAEVTLAHAEVRPIETAGLLAKQRRTDRRLDEIEARLRVVEG